jgi:hypothetical protein
MRGLSSGISRKYRAVLGWFNECRTARLLGEGEAMTAALLILLFILALENLALWFLVWRRFDYLERVKR